MPVIENGANIFRTSDFGNGIAEKIFDRSTELRSIEPISQGDPELIKLCKEKVDELCEFVRSGGAGVPNAITELMDFVLSGNGDIQRYAEKQVMDIYNAAGPALRYEVESQVLNVWMARSRQ